LANTSTSISGGSMHRFTNKPAAIAAVVTIITLAVPAAALAGGASGGVLGH
jgi:hypothetical protein